jgi:hypothetical protein
MKNTLLYKELNFIFEKAHLFTRALLSEKTAVV